MKLCTDERYSLHIKSILTWCSGPHRPFLLTTSFNVAGIGNMFEVLVSICLWAVPTERATRKLSRIRGGEKHVSCTVDHITLVIAAVVLMPRVLCTNLSYVVHLGSIVVPSARYLHVLLGNVDEVLKGTRV